MKTIAFKLFVFSCIVLIVISCKKIRSYPDTPSLEFKSFNYSDTTLTFHYIDGNGDFATDQPIDSLHQYNMFLSIYSRINAIYRRLVFQTGDSIPFEIDNVPAPQGQIKTRQGDITIHLNNTYNTLNSLRMVPDTFRFDLYIIDRNLNKSNKAVTPDIYKALVGKS